MSPSPTLALSALAVLAGVLFLPATAPAALTHRIEGLEEPLNAAWSRREECRGLLVSDLVVRQGGLALTTSDDRLFRLSPRTTAPAVCAARGWRVDAEPAGSEDARLCATTICELLETLPALTERLGQASSMHGPTSEEAPAPLPWRPPRITVDAVVLMAECLLAGGLLLGLLWVRLLRGDLAAVCHLRRNDVWALLGIALLAGALRLGLAMTLPVEFDETISVGYDSLWRELEGREVLMNPPLYRVFSYPLTWPTGGVVSWGRLLPVFLGAVSVVLMGGLGGLMVGRGGAYAAAVLTLAHPGWVIASVYHRSYSLWLAEVALATFLTALALRSRTRLDRYLTAACLAACVMTHYFGVGAVLAMGVWIAVVDGRGWRRWIGPAGLLLLLLAPFLPAVLGGASMKASILGPDLRRIGLPNAYAIAVSIPGVACGFLRPSLQTLVHGEHSSSRLLVALAVTLFLALAGGLQLRRRDRIGGWLAVVLFVAVPVLATLRLTTVRELHGVVAAVPCILFLAALTRRRAGGWIAAAGVALYLWVLFLGPPHLYSDEVPDPDAAAHAIEASSEPWPVFVWPAHTEGFRPVALRLGMDRRDLDASTNGKDPRARPLRSCSTAAVREAALSLRRSSVRVLLMDTSCRATDLSGRGVDCGAEVGISGQARFVDCQADVAAARPFPLPIPVSRPEKALVAGNEKIFSEAAALAGIASDGEEGVTLIGIGIGANRVSYELRDGSREVGTVRVVAMPSFLEEEIVGTEVRLEPEGKPLSPRLTQTVSRLRAELLRHLTPERWNQAFGSTARDRGSIDLRLHHSLMLAAIGSIVCLLALWREHPGWSGAEGADQQR